MSKKLLSFLLSELKTVRVICNRKCDERTCGGVVEVPLELIGQLENCPLCKKPFKWEGDSIRRFENFVLAVGHLKEKEGCFDLEFVLPDDS